MKIYTVGGAVRDGLLGLPIKDHDYVVVGSTPEAMLALGYTAVGKDFPVFLHPITHAQYALARTERKVAPGYRGFAFHTANNVTLEQDLMRRDLTINAIAMAEDGSLIDPFGGTADIQARIFRHVSPAFAEDPVRILRLARFAARFTDFIIAPETMGLMQQMVQAGEVDALVPERVWQEVATGLMEKQPSRMFAVLQECGALSHVLPGLVLSQQVEHIEHVDSAAQKGLSLAARCAILLHQLDKDTITALSGRLKIPNDCRDLAFMLAREQDNIRRALTLSADELVRLLTRCDAFRKPQRFTEMLLSSECMIDMDINQTKHLHAAYHAAQNIQAHEIAQRYQDQPQEIPLAIHAARVAAVTEELKK